MAELDSSRAALALALDAGQQAAAATRQIATKNSDPADPGTVFKRLSLGPIVRAIAGPNSVGSQIESACRTLDEFNESLIALNAVLELPEDRVDTGGDWSGRLWTATAEAAEVHNEVNAMLATLGRYRVNLIMDRPLVE